ncbi:MAG: hypothetical protein PHW62_03490 [Candidatus Ratteibacteria bacterium]|nr:hypothetical protein [Candidatus Ratteibacteria bacterium]
MAKVDEEYLQKTIEVYQPYSEKKLTLTDAQEINQNMMGFFSLLKEWQDKETRDTVDSIISELDT